MAAKAKPGDKRLRPLAKSPGESWSRRKGKLSLLRLVAEQGAVPYDQLLRFGCVGPAELAPVIEELQDDDVVRCARLLEGEQAWIWARARGARLAGLRFPGAEPGFSRLGHLRAINEVRLELGERAPQAHWICERSLRSSLGPGVNIPDAVLEIGDERHAVEVELTRKRAAKVRMIVAEHLRRYDALVYFCSPETLAFIGRLDVVRDDPRVIVRPLPGSAWPTAPHRRPDWIDRRSDRYHERSAPTPRERQALTWIAEQGIVPFDQLTRHLALEEEEADVLVARLRERGYVDLKHPLVGEPAWLALTYRGARASGTGLGLTEVRLGALAMARASNEVRLSLAARAPAGRWVARRRLAQVRPGYRPAAALPRGVFEIGAERHAIEIILRRADAQALATRLRRRSFEYDAVVCFCPRAVGRGLARLQACERIRGLIIKELPAGSRCAPPTPQRRIPPEARITPELHAQMGNRPGWLVYLTISEDGREAEPEGASALTGGSLSTQSPRRELVARGGWPRGSRNAMRRDFTSHADVRKQEQV